MGITRSHKTWEQFVRHSDVKILTGIKGRYINDDCLDNIWLMISLTDTNSYKFHKFVPTVYETIYPYKKYETFLEASYNEKEMRVFLTYIKIMKSHYNTWKALYVL